MQPTLVSNSFLQSGRDTGTGPRNKLLRSKQIHLLFISAHFLIVLTNLPESVSVNHQ